MRRGYHDLRIHRDGSEALVALRSLIEGATRSIDVCTFLLARDALGREIGELLMQRARVGVKVRVLLDGFGVWLGGHFDLDSLRAAGVEVVKFVPALKSAVRGLNLRNHRKMLLVDGERFWAGGRNLASEYFEGDSANPEPPWHDLSFDLRGPLAERAQHRFDLDWNYAAHLPPPRFAGPRDESPPDGAPLAQLIPSGPDQVDDTVQALLVSGAFMARERILAVTPYFVPDATLLMALTLAARRGVAVDLVLPARSNHRLADVARNRPLRDLAAPARASGSRRTWCMRRRRHRRRLRAGRLGQPRRAQPLPQLRADGRVLPSRRRRRVRRLDRRRASSRQRLSRADAGPHP
jgi:cardiolipin synthase